VEGDLTKFQRLKRGIENNPVLALILAAAFLISGLKPVWSLVSPWVIAPVDPEQFAAANEEKGTGEAPRPSASTGLPGECKHILVDAFALPDSTIPSGHLTLRVASYQIELSGDQLRQPTLFVLKLIHNAEPVVRAEATFVSGNGQSPPRRYDGLMDLRNASRYQVSWPAASDEFQTLFKYEPLSAGDFGALSGGRVLPMCDGISDPVTRVR
jgi:hypothetical protein